MRWLNYHHLLYFWTVASEGSIARASKRLRLAQPTISTQIRTLEEQLGTPLFDRVGRRLVLTEAGRLVQRYADEIFSLGQEMLDVLEDRPSGRPQRLVVGVLDAVPKLVAYRLLRPALQAEGAMHIECREDKMEPLLSRLALHEIDLILSDSPLPPGSSIKAFNHALGRSSLSFCAAAPLARRLTDPFPKVLHRAPMLLPSAGSALRRELDRWFDRHGLQPEIVGQFDDSALLKVFGQSGVGAFAVPTLIEDEVRRQFRVQVIGRSDELHESFFAISAERRLKHPGVVAICDAARSELARPD
jgi:LysR family transcriptional activator of nhaA